MWLTEDDVNFETAKLKIGAHYVPVMVAHINKSLTSGSTLGVEADHLEAFSKKYFDVMGSYTAIDSYGRPPLYYIYGMNEITTHPLMSVTKLDNNSYSREFLTGYEFPYKCDETIFCKNELNNKDVKYWAGLSTRTEYDGGNITAYSSDITNCNSSDIIEYIDMNTSFAYVEYDTAGVYSNIQSNYGLFLMIYSDVDNKFYSYHYLGSRNSSSNKYFEYSLPISTIYISASGFPAYKENFFVQNFFAHNGTDDLETIYIDFPVKDIVVKNYTPGNPDEPSGDDNKGTSPNDHLSLPDGDYNYKGDEITDDGAPDDNPNSMGTMGLWAPTRAQYKAFCKYLWNGFQQAMVGAFGNNDGMQCILACKEYPFVINATKHATMALGSVDTKLTVDVAPGNYFAIVYKGVVKNPSHSFMDYSPYSKVSIYLPYIGITDLDIDQVSGKEITVTYKIDIVSGIGVVLISTVDDDKKNIIIGSYPVQMGKELPVTATDYQRVAQSWASLAVTAGAVVAGVGLPMTAGVMPLVGTAITAKNSGVAFGMATGAGGAVAGSAGQAASSTKSDIKQSGSLGGCSGLLGISYPYLIYKMSNFSNTDYKGLIGKKSGAVVNLSTLKGSGFNKIEAVNLHIEGATDEELEGIKSDLLSGVIL